jgi:acyl carrier protein
MNDPTTSLVIDIIRDVIKQNNLPEPELKPETVILTETPLDSLALAEVVIRLETKTGKDPFAQGFINFRTIGELAELYRQ